MATRHEKSGTRNERRLERRLRTLLESKRSVDRVETFEEAGVMTMNRGLVIRLHNRTKFQVTVVEDRRGW